MFKFKLLDTDAIFHEEDCVLELDSEKYFYSTKIKESNEKEVYFKLNNKCNLKCIYCYQKEEDMNAISFLNLNQYKKLINTVFDEYDSFKFFGGEPFISINYANIKYLLDHCKNKKIAAFTNGTFNETYYQLLTDYKDKIQSITITLDGCADIHDRRRINTDGKGTFEKIVSNIKKLCLENIRTVIQINIDCVNYDSTRKLIKYIRNDNVLSSCMIVLNRVLHDDNTITNLQILQLYVSLINEFSEIHIEVNSPTIRKLTSIFMDNGLIAERCSAGKAIVLDFEEKNIYGCPENNKTICGNITNNNIIFKDSETEKLISYSNKEIPVCNSCKYKYLCHFGCSVDKDLKMKNCKDIVYETVQYVLDHFTDFFNIESEE